MKKYLNILGFLIVAGVLVTSVARAENGDRPEFFKDQKGERMEFKAQVFADKEEMRTERQAFMAKLKTEREAFMTELKAKKEAWKLANKEEKEKFRGRAQAMIGQRFDMAIRNLERMGDRLDAIIAELKADGEDTADAEEFMNSFEDKMDAAKDKLEDIKNLLPDSGEKITPEIFEQIKLLAREAKDLLKEAHGYLKDTIKEINGIRGDDNGDDEDEDEDEDDE